jgi:hypothetical protein
MRIDISLFRRSLPHSSGVRPHWRHGDAAARIGEANIPVRVRLGIALALTLILLPMHRNAYTVSMTSMARCWC